ncbi:MAG TPA: hypothetical protein VIK72_15600 [Clostridiaceae bacterium]
MKLISKLIVYIFPLISILVIINHVFILGLVLLILYLLWILLPFILKAGTNYSLMKSTNEYKKGNIEEAIRIYKKVYDKGKEKASSLFIYAYFLIKVGRLTEFEEVLEALSKIQLNDKEKVDFTANRALLHMKRGELIDAKDILEKEIVERKSSVIYGSLGYLYILMNDLSKALEFNIEANEFNSTDTVIADNLGQTYFLLKEYSLAEKIYIKLMEEKPTFPDCYYNYGLVLEALNKKSEALEEYKKALGCNFSFLSSVNEKTLEEVIENINSD